MQRKELHPYYRGRKPQVLADFKEHLRLACTQFEQILGQVSVSRLFDQFVDEFENVYPLIPYVGGEQGRMTPFFELGSGVIAVGRVLRAEGYDRETISKLMKSTFLAKL